MLACTMKVVASAVNRVAKVRFLPSQPHTHDDGLIDLDATIKALNSAIAGEELNEEEIELLDRIREIFSETLSQLTAVVN